MKMRGSHAPALLALCALVYGFFVFPQLVELLSTSSPTEQSATAINVSIGGTQYSYLTPTSGGTLTDAQGNVWTFLGGLAAVSGDTCDIKYSKNGTWAYGNGGAVDLVIYKGVLHQKSCVYGWYRDNGSGFSKDTTADATALEAIIAAPPIPVVVAPSITIQPSSQTHVVGESFTLSVAAAGTAPLVYQWYKGTAAISGAVGTTFTITSAKTTDSSTYHVTVTNSAGSVTSANATIVVNPADVTITTGSGSVVDSTGTTWRIDSNEFILRGSAHVGSQQYPGAWQTTTLVYHQADHHIYIWGSDNNWYYYNDSTGYLTLGASPVATNPAPFTPVVVLAPSITTQPTSQTLTVGGTISLSVVAAGTAPITYQWFKNGTALSGKTAATLTITNAQASDAGSYTVQAINSVDSAMSNAATVKVNTPVDVKVTPGSGSFVDSKGVTWKLDSNEYILRGTANVGSQQYPGAWQTTTLVYHQADQRVYAWGSDSNWYYYNDSTGYLALALTAPISPNPATFVPTVVVTTPTPAPTPAPTAYIVASSASVVAGQSVSITWSSTNATSCTGSGFSTGNAVAGSATVVPTANTTYSVSCTGAGGSKSASVTVTVTASTPAPTPTPSTFTPPGRVVAIAACNGVASHDTSVITTAIASAGAGNTAEFVAGTSYNCVVNSFTVTNGAYLYAVPTATVTLTAATASGTAGSGNTVTVASNATLNGSYRIQSCNIIFTVAGQSNATIGNMNIGRAGCGYDRVQADGSANSAIRNNNFSNTGNGSPGGSGTIGAYNPTGLIIDGNHFDTQIGNNDFIAMAESAGVNTQIVRNVFLRASAAAMEIGFAGISTSPVTSNLIISNNWVGSMNCGAVNSCIRSAQGVGLAYSIPINGPVGTPTTISGNYADGTTASHKDNAGITRTTADLAVELDGPGTITNNWFSNFTSGGYVAYKCPTGSIQITNNNLYRISDSKINNYGGCSNVSYSPNPQSTTAFSASAQPVRVTWGGQN